MHVKTVHFWIDAHLPCDYHFCGYAYLTQEVFPVLRVITNIVAKGLPATIFKFTQQLLFALLVSVGNAKAGDVSVTNYFGEDALSSYRRLTIHGSPQVYQIFFRHELTNVYSTIFAYAGEPSWIQPPTGTLRSFRWAWEGTSMNPGSYVARFEIGETNSSLVATTFSGDAFYADMARGSRELTQEEHRRLRHAVDTFLAACPLDFPALSLIDMNPELFEYRDHDRHLVAIGYGYEYTNVLHELHLLSLRAVRKTKLTRVGTESGSPSSILETNRPPSSTGSRR